MILSLIAKYDFLRNIFALSMLLLIAACNSEDIANSISGDANSSTQNGLNPLENKVLYDVSLSWAAPSIRENNQPISLSEIAGYKVYYGTSQRDYDSAIDIKDGSSDGYTFKNLVAGTYYFALSTYDIDGRESELSAEVKIIV